jgi:hypothetical protein
MFKIKGFRSLSDQPEPIALYPAACIHTVEG